MSYRTNDPLGGDLSGTVGAGTVSKIQGVVITGTPASTYTLQATSSTAASWQAPSGDITLAGDVTGAANSNTVVNIHVASVRCHWSQHANIYTSHAV